MKDDTQGAAEQIIAHLRRYGVVDKDRSGSPLRRGDVKRRGSMYRATLDLHGMTENAAEQALRRAFRRCISSGIGELLIIHGQGFHSDPHNGPVLKTLVIAMLENELRSSVKTFHTAPPKDGGAGATIVRLRFSKPRTD